jgi:murein DD-endopeptidase MepM/ murein hydrolase activator NlpD
MKRFTIPLLAALAAIGLAGCEREAPRTIVTPPAQSLPDDTVLNAPQAPPTGTPPASTGATSAAESLPEPAAPPTATLGAQPAAPDGRAAPTELSRFQGVALRAGGDLQGQRLLLQHALLVPVAGVAPDALADNYQQARAGHQHEAIDILAPAGTPVLATDDGRIAKLFHSKPGGLTIYQFDPAAQLAFYYAHLQRYAQGLHEGMDVRRGDVIGYVGSSGNADPGTPHLHFAVFRLGDPPKWWQGEPVNPYPALARAQFASR